MAVVLQTLVDSDFEHVVKITTSSTNSAAVPRVRALRVLALA